MKDIAKTHIFITISCISLLIAINTKNIDLLLNNSIKLPIVNELMPFIQYLFLFTVLYTAFFWFIILYKNHQKEEQETDKYGNNLEIGIVLHLYLFVSSYNYYLVLRYGNLVIHVVVVTCFLFSLYITYQKWYAKLVKTKVLKIIVKTAVGLSISVPYVANFLIPFDISSENINQIKLQDKTFKNSFKNVTAKHVCINNFIFSNNEIVDCDFSYTDLKGCIFNNCKFKNVNFYEAKLDSTKFSNVVFDHVSFSDTNKMRTIRYAIFDSCQFINSKMNKIRFFNSDFNKTNIKDNCMNTRFYYCNYNSIGIKDSTTFIKCPSNYYTGISKPFLFSILKLIKEKYPEGDGWCYNMRNVNGSNEFIIVDNYKYSNIRLVVYMFEGNFWCNDVVNIVNENNGVFSENNSKIIKTILATTSTSIIEHFSGEYEILTSK